MRSSWRPARAQAVVAVREGSSAQSIVDRSGEAIAVGADVSKAGDVVRLFKEVDGAFGRLDVLVNSAEICRFGPFAEITEESFYPHYNVNVPGSILTAWSPHAGHGRRTDHWRREWGVSGRRRSRAAVSVARE
jgi:NAD(P)-dependent dehydrogenase (short-subunit alcohol dehydrogenase family)